MHKAIPLSKQVIRHSLMFLKLSISIKSLMISFLDVHASSVGGKKSPHSYRNPTSPPISCLLVGSSRSFLFSKSPTSSRPSTSPRFLHDSITSAVICARFDSRFKICICELNLTRSTCFFLIFSDSQF